MVRAKVWHKTSATNHDRLQPFPHSSFPDSSLLDLLPGPSLVLSRLSTLALGLFSTDDGPPQSGFVALSPLANLTAEGIKLFDLALHGRCRPTLTWTIALGCNGGASLVKGAWPLLVRAFGRDDEQRRSGRGYVTHGRVHT